MTREAAIQAGKGYISEFMEPNKKGKDKYNCPLCGSGKGVKKTPAFSIKDNKFKCFSCDKTGDIYDLVRQVHGLDQEAAFQYVWRRYGISVDPLHTGATTTQNAREMPQEAPEGSRAGASEKIEEYINKGAKEIQNHPRAVEYLKGRGFTEETIRRFRLGYDPQKKSIIIPYGNDIPYYVNRTIVGKAYSYPKTEDAGTKQLFNLSALYNPTGEPVFLVESQLCAISIEQEGGKALALGGTGATPLINALRAKKTTNPLIISFDNDVAGETQREKLKAALQEIGIKAYAYSFNIGNSKDPNEALVNDPNLFRLAVEEAAQGVKEQYEAEKEEARAEYIRTTSAKAHFQEFLESIRNSAQNTSIPTGFPKLDKALDGGLYPGLYVIGAISSLGKTTFALQLVDQIAKSKRDVLVFSLEMGRNELMAKSISRITRERIYTPGDLDKARTLREITNGGQRALLNPAQERYLEECEREYASNYLDNLWIYEGVGDMGVTHIRDIVQKHTTITGNKPVVLIDYLQLLSPYDPRSTDKQNTDKAVLELKRITREFDIPIIAISSFNRSSYEKEVSMSAFKESGAIEYSSDVLIGLQLEQNGNGDINEAKRKPERKVELVILKNRNGMTGSVLGYDYYTKYNCFAEKR